MRFQSASFFFLIYAALPVYTPFVSGKVFISSWTKNNVNFQTDSLSINIMGTWNDFLRPLIFLNKESLWTLSLGLAGFQGTYVTQWNQLMAGSLITILPILVIFLFGQKYFIQGIVMSGMKE